MSAQRVVSLNCSNTEIVCALGCADRLVAVDDDSDWPVEVVAALPRVGRDLQIDIAAVQRLSPDLVLGSLTVPGHERVVQGLRDAGLPHLAPETQSLADTYADILAIGAALGVAQRAQSLVDAMRAAIAPVGSGPGPRVLVQWWPKPIIAPGRLSWVHDLLLAAGARNPLGERAVKSQPLGDEEVAALHPDAIVLAWCGVRTENYRPQRVLANPALAGTPAVRRGAVYVVPEAFLGRPGPRLVDGYRALRAVVTDALAAAAPR